MYCSSKQAQSTIGAHIISCDSFQGYAKIELKKGIIQVWFYTILYISQVYSLNNNSMEELSCPSYAKATEVVYKDNNTPVIIIAYEGGVAVYIIYY